MNMQQVIEIKFPFFFLLLRHRLTSKSDIVNSFTKMNLYYGIAEVIIFT